MRCVSDACSVTSMGRADFLRLMQRSTALRGDLQRLSTGRMQSNVETLPPKG